MLCVLLPLGAREISVTILDGELGIPLEGVEIRSYDGTSSQSDQEGRVVLTVPDDRSVTIRGSYPGYGSERLTVDPEQDEFFLELQLTGVLEAGELILEESRPRNEEDEYPAAPVAVPEPEEIPHREEVVVIEDTAVPVKPLPGLGYSGRYTTLAGAEGRAGAPVAVIDGFYIENPYHWGGPLSIFDPRTLTGARLSHGVFSSRYGRSVSGLLELSAKEPSREDVEFELDLSTGGIGGGLSLPLSGRGGLMIGGGLKSHEPLIWALRGISRALDSEILEPVESLSTAPYVWSAALVSDYRFAGGLELGLRGFFGAGGVGLEYDPSGGEALNSFNSAEIAEQKNYQGFGLADLVYHPRNDMAFKAVLGAAYRSSALEGRIPYSGEGIVSRDKGFSVQGRLDFDWDLNQWLLLALGLEEHYSRLEGEAGFPHREELSAPEYNTRNNTAYPADYVNYLVGYQVRGETIRGWNTSPYLLLEGRAGPLDAELGLRMDHVFFWGDGFSAGSRLLFSPRLNLDFEMLKDRGALESLSLSLGAGFFSSSANLPSALRAAQRAPGPSGDTSVTPTRSLTGSGGLRIEFSGGIGLDLEGYYSRVFDRTYLYHDAAGPQARSNGEGRVWGFDLTLSKLEGPRLDGRIAYSFSHVRYREPGLPEAPFTNIFNAVSGRWYYPSFHRFHLLDLVLNFRPTDQFTLTGRLGFAGGLPRPAGETGSLTLLDAGGSPRITQTRRPLAGNGGERGSFSIPLDITFSFFSYYPQGKARGEFYAMLENLLSPLLGPRDYGAFNPLTGELDTAGLDAAYTIPVPVISFGFKWSY
jgi:hypothetical protein